MSVFSACFFGTTAFVLVERPVLHPSHPTDHGQDAGKLDTVPTHRATTDLHTFSLINAWSLELDTQAGREERGTDMKDVSTFQ
jgi:hypothetical protein